MASISRASYPAAAEVTSSASMSTANAAPSSQVRSGWTSRDTIGSAAPVEIKKVDAYGYTVVTKERIQEAFPEGIPLRQVPRFLELPLTPEARELVAVDMMKGGVEAISYIVEGMYNQKKQAVKDRNDTIAINFLEGVCRAFNEQQAQLEQWKQMGDAADTIEQRLQERLSQIDFERQLQNQPIIYSELFSAINIHVGPWGGVLSTGEKKVLGEKLRSLDMRFFAAITRLKNFQAGLDRKIEGLDQFINHLQCSFESKTGKYKRKEALWSALIMGTEVLAPMALVAKSTPFFLPVAAALIALETTARCFRNKAVQEHKQQLHRFEDQANAVLTMRGKLEMLYKAAASAVYQQDALREEVHRFRMSNPMLFTAAECLRHIQEEGERLNTLRKNTSDLLEKKRAERAKEIEKRDRLIKWRDLLVEGKKCLKIILDRHSGNDEIEKAKKRLGFLVKHYGILVRYPKNENAKEKALETLEDEIEEEEKKIGKVDVSGLDLDINKLKTSLGIYEGLCTDNEDAEKTATMLKPYREIGERAAQRLQYGDDGIVYKEDGTVDKEKTQKLAESRAEANKKQRELFGGIDHIAREVRYVMRGRQAVASFAELFSWIAREQGFQNIAAFTEFFYRRQQISIETDFLIHFTCPQAKQLWDDFRKSGQPLSEALDAGTIEFLIMHLSLPTLKILLGAWRMFQIAKSFPFPNDSNRSQTQFPPHVILLQEFVRFIQQSIHNEINVLVNLMNQQEKWLVETFDYQIGEFARLEATLLTTAQQHCNETGRKLKSHENNTLQSHVVRRAHDFIISRPGGSYENFVMRDVGRPSLLSLPAVLSRLQEEASIICHSQYNGISTCVEGGKRSLQACTFAPYAPENYIGLLAERIIEVSDSPNFSLWSFYAHTLERLAWRLLQDKSTTLENCKLIQTLELYLSLGETLHRVMNSEANLQYAVEALQNFKDFIAQRRNYYAKQREVDRFLNLTEEQEAALRNNLVGEKKFLVRTLLTQKRVGSGETFSKPLDMDLRGRFKTFFRIPMEVLPFLASPMLISPAWWPVVALVEGIGITCGILGQGSNYVYYGHRYGKYPNFVKDACDKHLASLVQVVAKKNIASQVCTNVGSEIYEQLNSLILRVESVYNSTTTSFDHPSKELTMGLFSGARWETKLILSKEESAAKLPNQVFLRFQMEIKYDHELSYEVTFPESSHLKKEDVEKLAHEDYRNHLCLEAEKARAQDATELVEHYTSFIKKKIKNEEIPADNPFAAIQAQSVPVATMNPQLTPLAFPKALMDQLNFQVENIQTSRMEVATGETIRPYYNLKKNGNTYELRIEYFVVGREPRGSPISTCVVATFDALTVEAFKNVQFGDDPYQYEIDRNPNYMEFLIQAMYTRVVSNLGLAGNLSFRIKMGDLVIPMERDFCGLFRFWEKHPAYAIHYDSQKYTAEIEQAFMEIIRGERTKENLEFLEQQFLRYHRNKISAAYQTALNRIKEGVDTLRKEYFRTYEMSYYTLFAQCKLIGNKPDHKLKESLDDSFGLVHPDHLGQILETSALLPAPDEQTITHFFRRLSASPSSSHLDLRSHLRNLTLLKDWIQNRVPQGEEGKSLTFVTDKPYLRI